MSPHSVQFSFKQLLLHVCTLLACCHVFAQSSYLGLTPGISRRPDVDQALGQPVRNVSETLLEYPGGDTALKIYAQYRKNDAIVERMEILLRAPDERSSIQSKLGLPAEPAKSRVNSKNRLEEYYGAPDWIILTYSSQALESGVERIGYFSKVLFEKALSIEASQKPQQQPAPPTPPSATLPPAASDRSYDDKTTQAWNAMVAKDFSKALNLLQEAIRANSQRGEAYNLMGQAYLYGFNDIASTEKAMREALARNDKATFRVHHDHNGSFQLFCYGWLHISKTDVSFKSDEGHGFQWSKTEITEAKPNNVVGAGYSAFHMTGPSGNFNLAPGTLKKPETNLILALIGTD